MNNNTYNILNDELSENEIALLREVNKCKTLQFPNFPSPEYYSLAEIAEGLIKHELVCTNLRIDNPITSLTVTTLGEWFIQRFDTIKEKERKHEKRHIADYRWSRVAVIVSIISLLVSILAYIL